MARGRDDPGRLPGRPGHYRADRRVAHAGWPADRQGARLDPGSAQRYRPERERQHRAERAQQRRAAVTTVLTPVLTAHWDEPDSFTLAGFRRAGGYHTLPKAPPRPPGRVIAPRQGSGPPGTPRARLPTRTDVGA